jgi:hypothetical protein
MSRPKAKVLLEKYNKKNHRSTQACAVEANYCLLYSGQPIMLRDINTLLSNGAPKYLRVTHTCKGSALLLARKMNKLFSTDLFSVGKVTSYEPVVEAPIEPPSASKKKTK